MRFCFEIVFRRLDPDVDEVASSTCSHDGETDESVWNVCLALLDSEESLTVPSASAAFSCTPAIRLSHPKSDVFQ